MDRRHLLEIWKQLLRLLGPDHHWRDQIAGARRIVIEHAKDVVRAQAEPDLFLKLAQRCRVGGLTFLAAPARQRVLSFVGAQVAPAPRQHESRLTRSIVALYQGNRDGGPLEAVRIECRYARERRTSPRHQRAEVLTKGIKHLA